MSKEKIIYNIYGLDSSRQKCFLNLKQIITVVKWAISLNESIVASILRLHVTLQDDLSDCHPSVLFKQYINSQINFIVSYLMYNCEAIIFVTA